MVDFKLQKNKTPGDVNETSKKYLSDIGYANLDN